MKITGLSGKGAEIFGFLLFTLVLASSGASRASTEVVLDNGANGTKAIGNWKVSSGANYYGDNSLFSRTAGESYTYTVSLPSSGQYEVYARWTEWSNRRTSVPYKITHLGGVSTIKVDQTRNGGNWVRLGNNWSFGNTAKVVISSLGGGSTCADAVKFVPVDSNSAPVFSNVKDQSIKSGGRLIFSVLAHDDGLPPLLSTSLLPAGANFTDFKDGSGRLVWNTTSADIGKHEVEFIATDTSDPTLKARKKVTITVVDSNAPANVTLDNGQSGTSSTGTWKRSSGANPYGADSLYSSETGAVYSFDITTPEPGDYIVYARWTEWSNRRTDVPYSIGHSGGTAVVSVNQRQNGGVWNRLGTWKFGNTATISIRSRGNGSTNADAIRLVPTVTSPPSAPSAPTGQLVMEVDFENRIANTTYTEAQLIEDFNANRADGAIHGPNLGNTRIVPAPGSALHKGNVLRVRHPAGIFEQGASFKARFSPDNENKNGSARFDDVYFAYDIYLSPNTKRMPYHKLPGLGAGTLLEMSHRYRFDNPDPKVSPEGIVSFTALMQTFLSDVFPNRPDGALALNFYDANDTQKSDFLDTGDPTEESPGRSYVLPLGKWVTIEQRVKMNTADSNDSHNLSVDLNDGLAEVWIDGKKMSSKKHLWRWTNTMKADGFWFYDFYNHRPDIIAPPAEDQYVYYDNFRVSESPISH